MPLPETTPEQRQPLYDDIEDLVVHGFLSHGLQIRGVPFCLRSLGPGDLFLLRHRTGEMQAGWQLWAIASSIWLAGGLNLLAEPQSAPRLVSFLRRIPTVVLEILLSITMGLFSRQTSALGGIEAFCYEAVSRQLWKSHGRRVPSLRSGVLGVSRLGLNYAQQVWLSFNQVEDERDHQQFLWESAKLIASASAPKGIRKIDQKDIQRQEGENKRRQRVMDTFYYSSKGLVDKEGRVLGDGPGAYLGGPQTTEELAEDMRKWVSGEHDWHDRIVADYKRQLTERWEADQRVRAERITVARAAAERREEEEAQMTTPRRLVGYTQEQLQALLAERGPGRKQGVSQISQSPAAQHIYHRYLERPSVPHPSLRVAGGRVVDTMAPGELQKQLEGRRVAFQSGPEE